MNILILGNGFDLAHGLPTKYSDFLAFLANAKAEASAIIALSLPSDCAGNPKIEAYAKIEELLEKNIWYEYFGGIHSAISINGDTWIDFEKEIRDIIQYIDINCKDLYKGINEVLGKLTQRGKFLVFMNAFRKNSIGAINLHDFINNTYNDLQRLIICLDIYLKIFVETELVKLRSNDISAIERPFVLSFNYTHTLDKVYHKQDVLYHFIHGETKLDSGDHNNLILGVNEYWEGIDKDTKTNFNLYKKFVQRIMKKTGNTYKSWLETINKPKLSNGNSNSQFDHYVYIFGHSLNVTDGDILREFINTPRVLTTIFYKDDQQLAAQIANLSKVLGQDILITKTSSREPSIVFRKQQDMSPIE